MIIMRRVGGLAEEPGAGDCPALGDNVIDGEFGTLTWGDADCVGGINGKDARLMLRWHAGLAEDLSACPRLGDTLTDAPLPEADWEAIGTEFDIVQPARTGAQLSNHPSRVDVDASARNNGPEESGAGLFFEASITQGDVFVRWIAQGGDVCFDASDQQVVCQEGSPSTDPAVDRCVDGIDNDGDTTVDLDDEDCVEIRTVRESIFLFPTTGFGIYERNFTILCNSTGPVSITIENNVVVQDGYSDPNPNNNESQATLNDECFLVKGGSAPGSDTPSGARVQPYVPSALPNTGGRP
jgi:hypothetical protein